MENFIFQNPTKLIFGKGMIGQLAKEIPAGKRILVTFGGGSVRKNGVYDQVKEALKGFEVTEFWGIEANPKIETLLNRKSPFLCMRNSFNCFRKSYKRKSKPAYSEPTCKSD